MRSPSPSTVRLAAVALAAGICLVLSVGSASANATPLGPLPAGPVSTITAKRGTLVAFALPRQQPSSGLVWRLARPVDAAVLRQVSEGEIDGTVVVVYCVVGKGKATVRYALTLGESSSDAIAVRTYRVAAAGDQGRRQCGQ